MCHDPLSGDGLLGAMNTARHAALALVTSLPTRLPSSLQTMDALSVQTVVGRPQMMMCLTSWITPMTLA